MSQCFQVFGRLHQLLKKRTNLARVMREILEDFSGENTVYLELRTTPRNIYENDILAVSKREYVETIIEEIQKFEVKNDMIARLILSVDRTKGLEDALETVELCNEIKNEYIVGKLIEYQNKIFALINIIFNIDQLCPQKGIDFSGNPEVANFKDYKQVFELTKKYKLKITVHTAETWNDPDLDYIIKSVQPDRIGHAVCLSKEYQQYLLANPIPIEICPSSNLMTKLVSSLEDHPFNEFWAINRKYPLVICTDDRGMFDTSLTREQLLICNTFKLSIQDIFYLNKRVLRFIFDKSANTLSRLETKFQEFKDKFIFV